MDKPLLTDDVKDIVVLNRIRGILFISLPLVKSPKSFKIN